ncbi:MAG: type I secretion system permease/ATPase [Azospirillum sp.]|nr:type I secretion system permease/ATPase [Azospirillum sp.]
MAAPKPDSDVLRAVLISCAGYFASAGLFSMVINLLYLAPTVFMIQVSDRVLTSGSKETLVLLMLAYVIAVMTLGALDTVRSLVLIRAGLRIDRLLSARLMALLFERANQFKNLAQKRDEPIRTLDRLRQFVTGSGIHALFDLPWLPIYLFVMYLVHPSLAIVAVCFMALQLLITVLADKITHSRMVQAGMAGMRSYSLADSSLRNAEVVIGMGMTNAILAPWHALRRTMLMHQAVASNRNAVLASIGKFLRLVVQSLMMAVGAFLAIDHVVTPGGMFAAMLLIGRATQPLDQLIGIWKNMIDALEAYRSLNQLLSEKPPRETATVLPEPTGIVIVERLLYVPPQSSRPVIAGLSFTLEPGTSLAVIGPTASGKSSLARLLVGVYAPTQGAVRLDGADVFTWDRRDFGRFVGYLPQDVELFAGTVAQNISRFAEEEGDGSEIIEAARKAGAHDMILKLPKGYDTPIGDQGAILSAGQRQQIGLARAVYGRPRMIVLDEPNSNLDSDGEIALAGCLQALKAAKTTVILISHRPGVLNHVDRILYIDGGQPRALMTRDEFFAKLNKTKTAVAVS